MPKRIIPLTDMKVQKARPQDKPIALFDGGGLYLLITPSGGKLWRFKYRFDKKEKKLALGSYPEISLQDARRKREDARRLLANNIDPDSIRKAQKQAKTEETETFEVIGREWHTKFTPTWTPGHAVTIMSRLERDLFPWIGKRPINQIKAPELSPSFAGWKAGRSRIRPPDQTIAGRFPICRCHGKGRARPCGRS